MPQYKELEAALDRTVRAEYRAISEQSPFHNIAGHFAEIISGTQAQQLAILINKAVDALEGDQDARPGGSST